MVRVGKVSPGGSVHTVGPVRTLTSVVAVLVALALAGCGGTSAASTPATAQSATAFWRDQVASQFNGVVATGDGRGCHLETSAGGSKTFSCTAYVRNSDNSLSSGQDVIGSVTADSQGGMTANARIAIGNEIQDWFAKTGDTGYNGP